MRNCVLFCRVSSREQEETGYSLPAQERFLREYAERNSFAVAKVFAVSESASGRVCRKIFNEMIGYIEKKRISILIVETTDRLTRNFADVPTIDGWILSDESRQIHLAKEGCVLEKDSRSHEWFMWRVKVATAEYYIRLLSENVRKGQKEKIAQGWLPTTPPLGYKIVGEERHKIHVIDDEKGPLIRRMFKLYGKGLYSLKAINELMHKEGLRTRSGSRLTISHTHKLLTDPFFVGKVRWNGAIHNGSQEPLIGLGLFERVQGVLDGKTAPYYRKHNYLFRGIFRCFRCGRAISWERQKRSIYGHCHFPACPQKKWYKEPEIAAQILGIFSQLEIRDKNIMGWMRRSLRESHQGEIIYRESAISELKQQHDMIQKRLDRLYDDHLDETIDRESYDRRFRQYTAEKEMIEDKIKNHSQADTGYMELGINLYDISQNAREIYRQADIEKKRMLLKLVFAKLLIDDGKVVYNFTEPVKTLASVVNATNGSKIADLAGLSSSKFEPQKNGLTKPKNGALRSVHPRWLACVERFRTLKWAESVENPELLLEQAKELLGLIKLNRISVEVQP